MRNEKPATLGAWGKDTTQKAVEKGADPTASIMLAVQQMMEANEKRETKRDEELKNLQETIATRIGALELQMSNSNQNTMENKDDLLNVNVIISKLERFMDTTISKSFKTKWTKESRIK